MTLDGEKVLIEAGRMFSAVINPLLPPVITGVGRFVSLSGPEHMTLKCSGYAAGISCEVIQFEIKYAKALYASFFSKLRANTEIFWNGVLAFGEGKVLQLEQGSFSYSGKYVVEAEVARPEVADLTTIWKGFSKVSNIDQSPQYLAALEIKEEGVQDGDDNTIGFQSEPKKKKVVRRVLKKQAGFKRNTVEQKDERAVVGKE